MKSFLQLTDFLKQVEEQLGTFVLCESCLPLIWQRTEKIDKISEKNKFQTIF
jgi:hypothetical protein